MLMRNDWLRLLRSHHLFTALEDAQYVQIAAKSAPCSSSRAPLFRGEEADAFFVVVADIFLLYAADGAEGRRAGAGPQLPRNDPPAPRTRS
jgi:hypothetical protein